ncbi:MAG: hypothetical protein AAGG81_00295 [Chlamydiota bacterium]
MFISSFRPCLRLPVVALSGQQVAPKFCTMSTDQKTNQQIVHLQTQVKALKSELKENKNIHRDNEIALYNEIQNEKEEGFMKRYQLVTLGFFLFLTWNLGSRNQNSNQRSSDLPS